jgi:hypothetical protein
LGQYAFIVARVIDNVWRGGQYEGIGRITVAYSRLETTADELLNLLLGIKPELGEVVYGRMSVSGKFRLIGDLAKVLYRHNKNAGQKLEEFRDRAAKITEFRNKIQHYVWLNPREYHPDGNKVRDDLPMAIRAKNKKEVILPKDLSSGLLDVEDNTYVLVSDILWFMDENGNENQA